MLDILWTHILKRLEAFPDATFRESELVGVSKQSFDQMSRDGSLEFDHYDGDGDSYFPDRMGDQGVERTIRVRKDKITAFSIESDVATLELTKPETTYYRFNLNKLIDQIRMKNKLEEQIDSVEERLIFVGSLDSSGARNGFFLGLFDSEDELAQSLVGLPNNAGKYAWYIVLSPFNFISSQKIKSKLNGINVSHFIFVDAFDDGFVFKKGLALNETKVGLPQSLHLSGRVEKEKCIVRIDNQEAGLTLANFRLLARFVQALKTTGEGWATTPEMETEGLITDSDKAWQPISRLKEDLKRTFSGYDFDKFIQNGRKKYRLVIPADSVTYDRAMLKKIKGDATLTKVINKLPQIRKRKK